MVGTKEFAEDSFEDEDPSDCGIVHCPICGEPNPSNETLCALCARPTLPGEAVQLR